MAMDGISGVLTFMALSEDLAHLSWLIEEEIKRGQSAKSDVSYWKGLLARLKDSGVFVPTC